jgi:hypothetical protein
LPVVGDEGVTIGATIAGVVIVAGVCVYFFVIEPMICESEGRTNCGGILEEKKCEPGFVRR